MHLVVGGQRKRIRGMRDGGKEVRETKTRVEGNTDEKYIKILWEKKEMKKKNRKNVYGVYGELSL